MAVVTAAAVHSHSRGSRLYAPWARGVQVGGNGLQMEVEDYEERHDLQR